MASRKPKKPTLSLLSGKQTNDLDALAQMFKAITGRAPSKAEMKDARKKQKRG